MYFIETDGENKSDRSLCVQQILLAGKKAQSECLLIASHPVIEVDSRLHNVLG